MTSSPPPMPTGSYEPPRRAFGSISRSTGLSGSTSSTPPSSSTHLPLPLRPEANRNRSGSTTSVNSFERERETLFAAADKGITWLSAWAPKGEGRTRQFLESSLSGVATVASTVGTGVQGVASDLGVKFGNPDGGVGPGRIGRPLSFSAASPTDAANIMLNSPAPPIEGVRRMSMNTPPGPQHSLSTPAIVTTQSISANPAPRRPPQPSNFARLGSADSGSALTTTDPPSIDISRRQFSSSGSAAPNIPRSTSMSGPSVGPHGSSGLNPHAPSSRGSFSHTRSPSFNVSRTPSMSRSATSNQGTATGLPRSAGMPYKIGFQPAGVRNDKTTTFMEARKKAGVEREKEEGRLGRRWAKLVDLHFNPTTQVPTLSASSSVASLTSSTDPKPSALPRSASARRSLLSMDGALDALKPREVWRGLRSATAAPGSAEENRKRMEEQSIVKWEDDKEAKRCRICQSTFSLSNRKHHCRLCGRIVCSLPPTNPALLAVQIQLFAPADPTVTTDPHSGANLPQGALPPGTRTEKCSLLLVADWKSGRGEEVEEGFVGWMNVGDGKGIDEGLRRERRKSYASSISSMSIAESGSSKGGDEGRSIPLPQQPKEVQIKGLRTCRDCWAVVSRKQKMQDRQRVSGFARLYAALKTLQAEIEESMGDFEAQMDILTASSASAEPPPRLLKSHKQLLAMFAQYENISKRLSSLPAEEGGSQSLVQSAVARSGALFLAKQMAKVQTLPRIQKMIAAEKRKSMRIVETTLADQLRLEGVKNHAAEDVATMLQPLLEQEAQLEMYIADANAQRKYEDGKALGEALREIQAEIGRVTQGAMA